MFTEPVSTEIVCQVSDQDQRQLLQKHFELFYAILPENRFIPDAVSETAHGVLRCLSGVPMPYLNVVFESPDSAADGDACIEQQLAYFHKAKMPFVWYVSEEGGSEFKEKLIRHGFQDVGVFRGVIGPLDQPIPTPEVPDGCSIELIQDEAALDEFNELVGSTFGFSEESKALFKQALRKAADAGTMFHWGFRKEGKIVSALSTFIEGNMVSFWNGASVPEVRKQGCSTALRRLALQHAVARGCRVGASYLMAEGLAFGICSKLGYQTKWRFNAFLAPGSLE
jgi:hypothetical protein